MRIIMVFCCCLALLISTAQNKKNIDQRFTSLDTAFARILKDWRAPGFAVGVVQKDKVIYARGFGFRDNEAKAPVTTNTQFAIGSCTKAFTASLIGLLNNSGKIDIDKPVRNYLPALNFYNNEMNNNITLRDMMSHRTGVSRYDYSWYYFPSASRDSLLSRMQYMKPSEPLRRKWQYNNFMYLLQGMVTEKITGKSWEDNINEQLFQPLDMNNSNASLAEWMKAKDIAVGYTVKKDSIITRTDYYDISGMAPAGSINSSVNDMAKWLTLWINGGKYNGKEIIPASYISEAMGSQMVMSPSLPGKLMPDNYLANYGFGWMVSSYRGHYRVEHGGNIDGFSASTCFFPSDSIGIVVLSNQGGSAVPSIVRNLLADKVLGLTYKDWQSLIFNEDTATKSKLKEVQKSAVFVRKTGTLPSHTLKDYVGIYTASGKEKFELVLQHDSMFIILPREKFYLKHHHYDVFSLWDKDDVVANDSTNINGIKLMFLMNEAGDIVSASLPLEGGTDPILFTKSAKAKPLSGDMLQKYTGDYTLGGANIRVYVKGDNTLYVFVPGQPEYELVPVETDKFNFKVISGYSVHFGGKTNGEITELTFVQPNGNFKATKIVK